jgi:hypothetical protein
MPSARAASSARRPTETQAALAAWLTAHALRRGASGLSDEDPVFVTVGRHGRDEPAPVSNSALHKLIRLTGRGELVAALEYRRERPSSTQVGDA